MLRVLQRVDQAEGRLCGIMNAGVLSILAASN
jgi:hypothetical protein